MCYGCVFQAYPPDDIDLSRDGTFTLSFENKPLPWVSFCDTYTMTWSVKNNKLHNDNGAAFIVEGQLERCYMWFINGVPHREHGLPAKVWYADRFGFGKIIWQEWWENGNNWTKYKKIPSSRAIYKDNTIITEYKNMNAWGNRPADDTKDPIGQNRNRRPADKVYKSEHLKYYKGHDNLYEQIEEAFPYYPSYSPYDGRRGKFYIKHGEKYSSIEEFKKTLVFSSYDFKKELTTMAFQENFPAGKLDRQEVKQFFN